MELTARVLTARNNSFVSQYVRFAKTADEQRFLYPFDLTVAAAETIRICLGNGDLTDFIHSEKAELIYFLDTLFTRRRIHEQFARDLRKEGFHDQ